MIRSLEDFFELFGIEFGPRGKPWLGYGRRSNSGKYHEQVRVEFTHGHAWVDKRLADVLLEMNRIDALPLWSCQDEYIFFSSQSCLRKVLVNWPKLKKYKDRSSRKDYQSLRWKKHQLQDIRKIVLGD